MPACPARASMAQVRSRPPEDHLRREARRWCLRPSRIANSGPRPFRSRIVLAGSQPQEPDSWHDPSCGGLCSRAASSLTSPRRGRRGVFVKRTTDLSHGRRQMAADICALFSVTWRLSARLPVRREDYSTDLRQTGQRLEPGCSERRGRDG